MHVYHERSENVLGTVMVVIVC